MVPAAFHSAAGAISFHALSRVKGALLMPRQLHLALLPLFLLPTTALADSLSSNWQFDLTPYVWGMSVDGKIQPDDNSLPSASIDESFSDLLKELDAAFFLSGSARKDRFVVVGDLNWAKLSDSSRVTIAPGQSTRLKGEATQLSATLTAGYSPIRTSKVTVDALGGFRLWDMKVEADAKDLDISEEESVRWVDPILGARANFNLSEDWSLSAYGDVGGFGLGADLTWQLLGTANYQLTESISLSAGYRHLYTDYHSGGVRIDAHMSGPVFGINFRF